jgi:uncharacterized membrane protein YoaK (UPF0700 family)
VLAKLLALPVFCGVVVVTRLASLGFPSRNWPVLPTMLTLKLLLLIVGAGLAVCWGPFKSGDSWQAIVTGMTFVAAMAIQNAAHRIHLGSAPPSTLMTGTTTQLMIDIADSIRGLDPTTRDATRHRMRAMGLAIASFAAGAAAAALLFNAVGMWCFVIAPVVALATRIVAT